MATLSWKSSTLLVATLLVALGLQAGAVKILLNLNRSPEAATPVEASATPLKPTPLPPATIETGRQPVADPPPPSEAALPASTPKPTVAASDPPPAPVTPPASAPVTAMAHTEPNPEARLTAPVAAPPTSHSAPKTPVSDPSPTASNPPPATASVEAPPTSQSAPKTPVNDPPSVAPDPPPATASVEAAPRPTAGRSAPPTVAPPPVAKPSAEAATIKPTKPTKPATVGGLRDAAWLKARDPKNYTVQLYSGKDLDKLKEIAAETASTGPQAYFTTESRTGPLHSLVIGDYSDPVSARTVAAAIAARSTQIKPWVRRLGEIQADMR